MVLGELCRWRQKGSAIGQPPTLTQRSAGARSEVPGREGKAALLAQGQETPNRRIWLLIPSGKTHSGGVQSPVLSFLPHPRPVPDIGNPHVKGTAVWGSLGSEPVALTRVRGTSGGREYTGETGLQRELRAGPPARGRGGSRHSTSYNHRGCDP